MKPTLIAATSENTGSGIGIRSIEERRGNLMGRIAKADGAIAVAERDLAEDSVRALKAEGETQEIACGALMAFDVKVIDAKEKVRDVLQSILPAFDIPAEKLTREELTWANENIGRIRRAISDVPKGSGRADGLVKQVRLLRASFVK